MAVWLMADPLVMFTSEPVRIEEIRARHGQRAIEVILFGRAWAYLMRADKESGHKRRHDARGRGK